MGTALMVIAAALLCGLAHAHAYCAPPTNAVTSCIPLMSSRNGLFEMCMMMADNLNEMRFQQYDLCLAQERQAQQSNVDRAGQYLKGIRQPPRQLNPAPPAQAAPAVPAPWPADRIRPGAEEPTYPPPPAPQVTYSPREAWDSYVSSTGRYVHRNLLVGSDGTYKVVATDHDAASNSNGGSVCIFNAGGWSDCVSKAGDRYQ